LCPGEKNPMMWRNAVRQLCERLGLDEQRQRMVWKHRRIEPSSVHLTD
jgi:hypothetical protein